MAGGSTPVSSSLSEVMSTARTPWFADGCSTSGLVAAPLDPSSSNQAGKPCAPPPSEIGSLVSILSASTTGGGGTTRVTSNLASAITMGIIAITPTVATAVLVTGRGDVTPVGKVAPPPTYFPHRSSQPTIGWVSTLLAQEVGRFLVPPAPWRCQISTG